MMLDVSSRPLTCRGSLKSRAKARSSRPAVRGRGSSRHAVCAAGAQSQGPAPLRASTLAAAPMAPPATWQPRLTSAELQEMLADPATPVLAEFHAPWCGPCRVMDRVLREVGGEFEAEGLKVVKINIEKHPCVAKQYRVQGLPTLLLFREGAVVDAVRGVLDADKLRWRVNFYLQGLDRSFGRR